MGIRTIAVIFVALSIGVGWGSSQPAFVQPAVQQAAVPADAAKAHTKIDPAKEAEIRRLLDVIGAKKNIVGMLESFSQNIRTAMLPSFPSGQYRQRLVDLTYAKFQSKADAQEALNVVFIPIYDKYYSRDEIESLIKLSETPVAKKILSVGPQIMKESMDGGVKWSGKIFLDFVQEILAEHPEMAESLPVKISADQQRPSTLPADTSTARANIDPTKEAELRQLIDITGSRKLLIDFMQMFGKLLQSDPANPFQGKYRETLTDLYVKYIFQTRADYWVELAIPLYDKYFSREEIETLIKLYKTPIMQKSISVLPQLTQETFEKFQPWFINVLYDSIQEVLVEHPDLAEALEQARKAAQPK
jgi:hypothetical protein